MVLFLKVLIFHGFLPSLHVLKTEALMVLSSRLFSRMFVYQTILDNTKNIFLHSCFLTIIRYWVWCVFPIIQHDACTSSTWPSSCLLVQTGTEGTDKKMMALWLLLLLGVIKYFISGWGVSMTSARIHEPVVSCASACKHSKISDSFQFLSLTIFTFVLILAQNFKF